MFKFSSLLTNQTAVFFRSAPLTNKLARRNDRSILKTFSTENTEKKCEDCETNYQVEKKFRAHIGSDHKFSVIMRVGLAADISVRRWVGLSSQHKYQFSYEVKHFSILIKTL